MNQLETKFNQLWHDLGSVNSQPQGQMAQALDYLEPYIKQVWKNLNQNANPVDIAHQKSATQEILTLLYIRQLCRTGLREGFMVADPNQDGIPELFWLNNGNLWVMSPVGGRLLYWVDLTTGQVRASIIENRGQTQALPLRGALQDRLTVATTEPQSAEPDELIPVNTRYSYMFRDQILTFQYNVPQFQLTKQLQFLPDSQQFEIYYTIVNATDTTLRLDYQSHNEWTVDALSLEQSELPAFTWQIEPPQTYILQSSHTTDVISTQAPWAEKWFCQSNLNGCYINPGATVALLPAQTHTMEIRIKSNTTL